VTALVTRGLLVRDAERLSHFDGRRLRCEWLWLKEHVAAIDWSNEDLKAKVEAYSPEPKRHR